MGGLYQRALSIISQEELLNSSLQGEFTFDEDSGISIEEQKEILTELQSVMSENKMSLDLEKMVITPQKKGFLFPFMNFLITALFAAGLIFWFQMNFQIKQQDLAIRNTAVVKADDLLKQIQADTDAALQNKENEISQINSQLKELDAKQANLEKEMNQAINDKQKALEEEMTKALEEEKQRLLAQGISTEDIQSRVEAMESQRKRDIEQQMSSFQKEQEKLKQENEKLLSQMKNEYQSSLTKADDEKKRIQAEADAKLKEAEVQRAKEIEEQKKKEEALTTEIRDAKDRLQLLSEQRKKEENINSMISGYYNAIKVNIEEKDYTGAKVNIGKMQDIFKQQDILDLPGMVERRQRELLVINLMSRMVDSEANKPQYDTASVLAKANTLTQVSTKVQSAEKLYSQGSYAEARKLYEEALAIIPEIKDSYFKNQEIDKSTQQELYTQYVSSGNALFSKGDYKGAIDSYSKAIKVVPETESVTPMLNNILEAGYNVQGVETEKAKEDKQSELSLSRGNIFYNTGSYTDAVDKYLEILTLYPRSSQVNKAKEGIAKSISKLQEIRQNIESERDIKYKEYDDTLTEKENSITGLNETLQERDGSISNLNKSLKEKEAAIAQKATEVKELSEKFNNQLALLTKKNEEMVQLKSTENDLKNKVTELETKIAGLEKQLAEKPKTVTETQIVTQEVIPESMIRDLEAYTALKDEMESVKTEYYNYTLKEDSALETSGSVGYLTTRPKLGEILNSDFMSRLVPGMYKRISDYETALTKDAKADGSYLAIDSVLIIIDRRLSLKEDEDPYTFWESVRQEYKDDEIMLDLIDELEYLKEE